MLVETILWTVMNPSSSSARARARLYFWPLLFTTVLFCLRVLGQLIVARWHVHWLPPMNDWFSGAIPYSVLLICQLLIVFVYARICWDFGHADGFWVRAHPRLGRFILEFGAAYLAVMLIRYAIRMALYPMERWTGGCIPIFFHWDLALFLILVGRYQLSLKSGTATTFRTGAAAFIVRLTALGLVGCWVIYQIVPFYLASKNNIRSPQYAVRISRHASMRTSDGVDLVADIYSPDRLAKAPTILVRVPYSKSLKNIFYADVMGRIWAERGYVAVIQGARGRCESGGNYYPLINERRDGIETLKWISQQSWYNGQIATWGGSTFGYSQWVIGDQSDPGPSVLEIYEASTDFYRMFYPGGAFSLETALGWAVNSRGKEDMPNWPATELIFKGAAGLPLIDADKRTSGVRIPFFRDWAVHTKRDSYWEQIDGTDRAKSLKAPVLLMAGWFDPFLPTQLQDYVTVRSSKAHMVAKKSCLIVGPWTHAGEAKFPDGTEPEKFRPETVAISIPWFDSQLNDVPTQSPNVGDVKIYVMGKNQWRTEREWPLARTRYTPFYLQSEGHANSSSGDGLLSLNSRTLRQPADTFEYDPRNPVPAAGGPMFGPAAGIQRQNEIECRSDVLVYSTEPLQNDVEVTGPVKADLFVDTSEKCTDFTAKLVDVYPDGSAYNVCDGIKRLDPGEVQFAPRRIAVDLYPTSIAFLKGHRIRLEISSSNFPRFDANPNTGGFIPAAMTCRTAKQVIYHDAHHPSALVLPVIPAMEPKENQ